MPSDIPEDRAAAARRVARLLCEKINPGPNQHHVDGGLCGVCQVIAPTLLAFPGGDAEPVSHKILRELAARADESPDESVTFTPEDIRALLEPDEDAAPVARAEEQALRERAADPNETFTAAEINYVLGILEDERRYRAVPEKPDA